MRKWLAMLMCCVGCAPAVQPGLKTDRWAVYYDKKLSAEAFESYDLVVFDRRYHPNFTSIQGDTTVLAYVSIGEIPGDTEEYASLKKEGAVLAKSPHWGSYVADLGNERWRQLVLDKVDDAMEKGFDGVMLDTVDSPLHHAGQKGKKHSLVMRKEAISLIRAIRERHPHATLMLNRGFEILPEVATMIDISLAESILAQTDVSTGQSRRFPANTFHLAVTQLEEAQQIAPQLRIYTLDYWNQDDVHGIRDIYEIQRSYGFSPYVTTPDLRAHTPEPRRRFRLGSVGGYVHA